MYLCSLQGEGKKSFSPETLGSGQAHLAQTQLLPHLGARGEGRPEAVTSLAMATGWLRPPKRWPCSCNLLSSCLSARDLPWASGTSMQTSLGQGPLHSSWGWGPRPGQRSCCNSAAMPHVQGGSFAPCSYAHTAKNTVTPLLCRLYCMLLSQNAGSGPSADSWGWRETQPPASASALSSFWQDQEQWKHDPTVTAGE